jgi:hypothetical protein
MAGIFSEIQLGDLPTLERSKSPFEKLFLDPLCCDLSDVGRIRLNQELKHLKMV